MALPLCADLTLMMILSVVCQAEDGTVVDLRVDQSLVQTQPLGPTLFGVPGSDSSSNPTTTTKTFSSSTTTSSSSDEDDNKDKRQRIPYCDEVKDDEYKRIGVCGDRMDGDDIDGYPCGGGVYKANWRDCDGGLYGDNDDEIEYVEDHNKKYKNNDGNSNNIGEELGIIMEVEDDNDEAGNSDDNNDADANADNDDNEAIEDIGDEIGDVMKD